MNAEFEELLGRYLDGSASAEEVRQVDEQIRQDPAAREALFWGAAMEVDLRRLLANPLARPLAEGRTPHGPSRRRFAYAAVAAVAVAGWALALLLVGQYRAKCGAQQAALQQADDRLAALKDQYRAKCGENQAALERLAEVEAAEPQEPGPKAPNPENAVGRLVATRGLVLATPEGQINPIQVVAESPIPLGGSLWTCPWGGATMRFADGAAMDMERGTEVAFSKSAAGRRATINHGILVVNTKEGSAEDPIVITTAHASVRVAKAHVTVEVKGDRTIVEVAEGRAQVTRTSDGRTLTVGADHYAVVSPAEEPKVVDGRLAWQLEPMGQ